MVEGTFARVFKSELQPVEVASAIQHEMDERAAIVAQGRTLVPNDFVVEIAQTDAERLDILVESLSLELATLARDHAREQGYSFVGPVRIRFEGVPELATGMFRIRSGVIRGHTVEAGEVRQPVSDLPRSGGTQFPGRPRLVISGSSPGTGLEASVPASPNREAARRLRNSPPAWSEPGGRRRPPAHRDQVVLGRVDRDAIDHV